MVNLYLKTNIGATKIARYLGQKEHLICRILSRNNVEIRSPEDYRLYPFDENFFDKIDTEKKAYWLGFLIADGCNYGDRALKFSISTTDEHMLEYFKQDIGSNAPIKRDGKGISTFVVYSKKLISSLKPLGFVQRKTDKTFFPNIPVCLYHHFIRGYFDGDGCASVFVSKGLRGKTMSAYYSMAGTENLLSDIQAVLMDACDLKKNKLIQRKGIKVMTYGGTNQVEKIYHYLYDDATIFLDRKRKKIYDFLVVDKKRIAAEYKLR